MLSSGRLRLLQVSTCPDCEGSGEVSTPCETCRGDGRVRKSKKISLKVVRKPICVPFLPVLTPSPARPVWELWGCAEWS